MHSLYNAAIIGTGSIGGLIDSPSSSYIASHAHAYKNEPRCKLTAIYEPNIEQQEQFKKLWGEVDTFLDTRKLLDNHSINLLSICSPTTLHVKHLKEALFAKNIQTILCEKPLVSNNNELHEISPLLKNSQKKTLINTMRRYIPRYQEIANMLSAGKWGKIIHFQAIFNKGLLHNGIHMLDTIDHLIGDISKLTPLHVKPISSDLLGEFSVSVNNTVGSLHAIDTVYSIFELTIWCENGKVIINEGGNVITTYTKEPSPNHKNYFSLEKSICYENVQQHAMLHSLQFLLDNDISACKYILDKHIKLHELVFKTIQEEQNHEISN